MNKLILILSGLLFFVQGVKAESCEEKQGAVDFGSGTTKAFVAVVDVCRKEMLSVVYEERLPLPLNEALEKSDNKELPPSVLEKALPQIQAMIEKMREQRVQKISGVATSVFRVAKNGSQMARNLSQKLQIPVQVISQEREAELGFWSALAQKKQEPQKPLIVWDIGGGSMQMYSQQNGKVHIYQGDMASVTYKNKILEVLQFKDPKKFSSPNPIGRQREAALQLAKNHAYLNVPAYFKKEAPRARWIGVGGVLSMSVQRQVHKGATGFTQSELDQVLQNRVHLKDADIDSDYRISDISNLALVLGYMQALKIEKVETVQASLGQGLLFYNLHH
ncbi:Ppx/GppA phosphatase family protein [Bdellovibrio sp.]|uniref:Ppx/GppA phosphatase family protein n=1 Tax=Bdellovibrio sp. TaxID=28201 RepID=UPI0039E63EDC